MAVTSNTFRQHLPEFADQTDFPPSVVDYWISIAVGMLNASRWMNMLDHGIELYVAHQLTLEAKAMQTANNGGLPGTTPGIMNNKSVDKVSVGYDTSSVVELDAGHWNLSIYGLRFIRLARMFGAGPLQTGGGVNPDPLSSANAWPGPDTNPGFSNFS